jgi:hypothetical protein
MRNVYIKPEPEIFAEQAELIREEKLFLVRNLKPAKLPRKKWNDIYDVIGPARIRRDRIFLMRNLNPKQYPNRADVVTFPPNDPNLVPLTLREVLHDYATNVITRMNK